MAKKDIGFRFDERFHKILVDLSARWECTRTETVERSVMAAAERESTVVEDEAESSQIPISQEPGVMSNILPNDPKEVAKVAGDLKVGVPSKKATAVAARTQVDPELVDAFQRKMAQGKKK